MSDKKLSDEEIALFRSAMRSVKPLQDKTLRHNHSKGLPTPALRKKSPAEQAIDQPPPALSSYIVEEVQAETVLSYRDPGLSKQQFKHLQQGRGTWEARLDLHGFKPEQAQEALCQFIKEQQALAHRLLLIIHGKGGRSGNAPVLKNLVNRWLPQLDAVLAFHSAQAKDGGNGAVYVLLKKSSPE